MVGYSGTGKRKSRQHARPHLNHRVTPRLYLGAFSVALEAMGPDAKPALPIVRKLAEQGVDIEMRVAAESALKAIDSKTIEKK
jgi:hypothetical protein